MAAPGPERSVHEVRERSRLERLRRDRRDWNRRFGASLLGHAVLVALFAYAPAPKARPMPRVVTVDLVAAPRPAAAARPKAPAPKPAPEAAEPPPPPPPAQKKIVLPREAPKADKKPRPKPDRAVRPPRRTKPEELDYDDALAKLREELGEPEPSAEPPPETEPDARVDDTGSGAAGTQVPPEVARWILDTVRHVRATYVTPPEFRGRGLRTCLTVFLTRDGRVLGEPDVMSSSGDAYWDDNAVRATLRASPLPAPPGEGDWTFCFPTEDAD